MNTQERKYIPAVEKSPYGEDKLETTDLFGFLQNSQNSCRINNKTTLTYTYNYILYRN